MLCSLKRQSRVFGSLWAHRSSLSARTLCSANVVRTINSDLPASDNPNVIKIRHTTAHIMAMAVQKLYPECKVSIGPWIENGFYYDFFFPGDPISEDNLRKIKKEMDKIIRLNLPITREEVSREEARKRIEEQNEPYKLEILQGIPCDQQITIYHIGDKWWDLCAGPHVEATGQINPGAVELRSVAGAYWKGDENNPMLQRIYGTAWETPEQLDTHKLQLEEAKRRDHRILGKRLNLFSIQESAGGGLVFWHSKGAIIRKLIEDYWKEQHIANGYDLLYTPHIADVELWKTSGHHDFYSADMFRPIDVDEQQFQLKPMNCPFHCLVYKDELRSYRELPIRWAEMGTVYRYERSGSLHGLMRVRGFTQDDAHIFCLPEHLQAEIRGVLDLTESILRKFGFDSYSVMLSTRPPASIGSDNDWTAATNALIGALDDKGWSYSVDEGGGAFYGPKIDIKIRDAIGRLWQCSTIQCDFNLPQRFALEYVAADQSRQRPIMLHRAIFGSLERFFGILIENTAGDFPLWLAPVHLKLLPITDDVVPYCLETKARAKEFGIRVDVDPGLHRIGKQIRAAEMERIPVMAVVGAKERDNSELSLRLRGVGDVGTRPVDLIFESLRRAIDHGIRLEECLNATPTGKT